MMCFFVIVGLLVCIEAPGSSAVTPVFVQKGNDLLLEIMEADVPEDFSLLSWTFNGKDFLITFSPGREPRVSNLYSGRVEASVKNFSVKLKNLQESDSGVYTARVTGDQEQILSEYKVTVQDPVSPVELTVDSVSSSSDSCNLTVTCSTQDSHHININSTFTCDTKTCSQEGGERSKVTSSGASLRVYLVNDSIICNHSNQVSWEKDNKMTERFCEGQRGSESLSDGVSLCLVKTVLFSVGLIIMVSAVISVHLLERLKKQK
ncbi:SLAM family member 9-like [Trachinotus anak]|uniref:SLAM family member 9-like n=1 Tax=Trachinotus anak TaxID=443729 RepID=UPI0039F24CCF